jgi:hypothetical protein
MYTLQCTLFLTDHENRPAPVCSRAPSLRARGLACVRLCRCVGPAWH